MKNFENDKINKNQLANRTKHQKNLWFVNIGGYDPSSMQEKHEFGLVIASNKLEAKNKAKSKWLIGYEKKHKDDMASIEILISCDNCAVIKKIGDLEIELIPDKNVVEQNDAPDWFGYKRIDKI